MKLKHLAQAAAVAVMTILTACSQAPTTNSETTLSETSPVFDTDRFEVSIVGTGPDVILIPGLASSGDVWNSVTARLQDEYRFHVIQVSGFGGAPSQGNAGETDILNAWVDDLSAYSQSLETKPAIIGHSLGGLLALRLGLEPAAAAERLLIIDVLPFFSVLIDENATAESMGPFAAGAKAVMMAQSDEVYAQQQREALSKITKSDAGLELAVDWTLASDRAVVAQAMSEVLVLDLRNEVARLDLPVSVMYARDPEVPNMERVEQLYLDLYAPVADLNLIPVDGALHFIMFDQEQIFLDQVEAFLRADD